jgi:diguanylate cyclase
VIVLSLGMAVLHLYAAWVLHGLPVETRPAPVRALQALLVVAALVEAVPIGLALWAWDYNPLAAMAGVVLPLALDALTALSLCMVLTHDRTAQSLNESQSKLRMLANMDGLTSMPNRRHFRELADRMLERCETPPAIMLFDIDHFKQVNDQHGHAVGDEALRLVARSARTTFRGRDIVGRLGGDEFVALMPSTSMDDAMRVADRMVRHVARARADYPRVPTIGMSFGVVTLETGERFEDALKRADDALYEAKRQGRGCAVAGDTEFGHSVFGESRRLGLEPL